MTLGMQFDGNDWSDWEHGTIVVGGAIGGADNATMSYRNEMVLRSARFKLPIAVAVEQSSDTFCYLGKPTLGVATSL